MQQNKPPANVASTAELGLVPCALCGGEEGFTLGEGSTFRWFSLSCSACGQEVDEIRIAADPIAAWNKAGAHAAGLRAEIDRLRAALKLVAAAVPNCVMSYKTHDSRRAMLAALKTAEAALGPNV